MINLCDVISRIKKLLYFSLIQTSQKLYFLKNILLLNQRYPAPGWGYLKPGVGPR